MGRAEALAVSKQSAVGKRKMMSGNQILVHKAADMLPQWMRMGRMTQP